MKTILYITLILAVLFTGSGILAQKERPGTHICDTFDVRTTLVISWQNNVLHVIEKQDSIKINRLGKMITTARNEAKKMQKTIAAVDQPHPEHSGIFHYKRSAEGLKDNFKTVMIH